MDFSRVIVPGLKPSEVALYLPSVIVFLNVNRDVVFTGVGVLCDSTGFWSAVEA